MQFSTILLLFSVTVFLILILHAEETQSLYPYAIRGFVSDVRLHPFRFIGGLFFKKAFLLKKLKLKWKLKKKFVLKKLLKKLILGSNLGLKPKTKSLLPQIFAQPNRGLKESSYYQQTRGTSWGGGRRIPPLLYNQQSLPHYLYFKSLRHHHHQHHHFHGLGGAIVGRKRRAIRFPDEDANGSSSFSGSSSDSLFNRGSTSVEAQYDHHFPSASSTGSRTFFDDESFSQFQHIGLGQQELEMLRQLPVNLQYEYRQEMQELETSASEPRETDILEYLAATNEFDTDHCIARGICETMARGNRTTNQFENSLLDYYNEEPETRKDPNGESAYIYDYAAFLGKSSRNDRACASHFPKCPEPTQRTTSFMNEIFSSEMCDPPVRNEL